MANKHQEHPEDLLLTGETWALDAMFAPADISLKIDGCPAVIWGTHPENGKFFVGTKSVFNKRLIKICYSTHDVHTIYAKQPSLARVLASCYQYLPRTEGVFQGDFIGFGGTNTYTPNTLTYKFNKVVTQNIIIAPHTEYSIPGKMCDAVNSPISVEFSDTANVKFVQPIVDRVTPTGLGVDTSNLNFLSDKEAAQAKVAINALIRSGQAPNLQDLTDIIGDADLAAAYQAVVDLKQQVLDSVVVYNAPTCLLGDRKVTGEGLVFSTPQGLFKVVDRLQFSFANFTKGKFA